MEGHGGPDGSLLLRQLPGYRALAGFWAAIVLTIGAGAAVLQYLGPPEPAAARILGADAVLAPEHAAASGHEVARVGPPRLAIAATAPPAGRPVTPFPAAGDAAKAAEATTARAGPNAAGSVLDVRENVSANSPAANFAVSNGVPTLEVPRQLRIHTGGLQIARPEDPDGDPLVVTIRSLPHGLVRNGIVPLRIGDQLRPEELAGLVFTPEPGFTGEAGSLRYLVEDGRGGRAESGLVIDVISAAEAAAQIEEASAWERLRGGRAEDIGDFIRLYPKSRYTEAAWQRLDELLRREMALAALQSDAAGQPASRQPVPLPSPEATPQPTPGPAIEQLALLQPLAPPSVAVSTDERRFQDCPQCTWMVRLPAGTLMMGQGSSDSAARPVRQVMIHSFALGQFPVTVAEWKACAAAGGCGALPRMDVAEDSTPLHNVSWDDAQQYIAWLSRTTGRSYRLPSEAEWEYAARAGTQTRYWWGDQLGVAQANCADCGGAQDQRGPMPVGSFQPNGFGLYGMLGGVAQWVQDCWVPNYKGTPADGSAREARGCMQRVLRGGSFRSGREEILPVARNFYDAPVRYQANGFRVARSLD